MFFQIIIIFGILSTIIAFTSEDKYEIFNKSNISYEVSSDGVYFIREKEIPVLRAGAITDIESMKTLRLYDDKIEEIHPGAFQNLPNLQALEIYENKIEKIQAGIFNNLNLFRLDLSNNGISKIDSHAFDNIANLNFINLANNQLKQWDVNWFAKTPSLRSIHLSYNSLEEIPAHAIGGPNEKYEGTADKPFNIFLEGNNIKTVDDDAFRNLKIITVLSLSGNQIQTLNGSFLRGLQISELYLNSNKIQCLNDGELEKIFVANLTQVIDNPWDVDCLENLRQWAKTHQKNIEFFLG